MRAVPRDPDALSETSEAKLSHGFLVSPDPLDDMTGEPRLYEYHYQHNPVQHRRFVAGAAFFNYHEFGSLRPGHEVIALFSRRYVGLAVHVTLCGFVFHFFALGYGRLLGEYLKSNSDQQVNAANYVLMWPQTLAVVIGLVSDAFPICGFRRKSYMVLGWLLSLVMYLAIIVLDVFGHSGDKLFALAQKDALDGRSVSHTSQYPLVYLTLSLVAGIGIQISWTAAVAVGIEYGQREHIHHRGKLIAALTALYYFGGVLGKFLIVCVLSEGAKADHWMSTISLGTAAIILAGVSILAIPIVLFCYEEDASTKQSHVAMAMGQRLTLFWRLCHQNVVYRVLFFVGMFLFLLGIYNQNVHDAVEVWCDVSPLDSLVIEVLRMAGQVLGTLQWRYYLRNASWRKLAFWGTVMYLSLYIIITVCAAYNLLRSRYFYGTLISLGGVLKAWAVLYGVVLATEIAEIGHEGVTVGLAMSFNGLSLLADYTIAAIFPKIFGFKVTMDEVREDAQSTRNDVMAAFCIGLAFNLLVFVSIRLPPQQKLDAQQMRAFGGYNRFAGVALLLTFVVFVTFNLAANVVVVL